jgi:3-oxoacyl-[acyl-carrier protein] reductase
MPANNADSALRLKNRAAVIFGAGGEVGAAVARELAAQGARVFLSGRRRSGVQAVADAISSRCGTATAAEVDALDEDAVNRHVDDVAAIAGRIDITFNAMGPQPVEYGNATSTMDLPLEKFMLPMLTIVRSQFITARSTARYMIRQRSGVIIFLSATPSRGVAVNTSAIGAAYGALESLTRCLATDLGPYGIRALSVRSVGMPQTRTIQQSYELGGPALGLSKDQMAELILSTTLLRRSPSLADTAKLIAFLASDEADTLTGAIINSSSGQVLD